MFSLARQDDKIINRPHIPKLKEPRKPRKGFFEYSDFVKMRDHLDPALRNIAEFEYVTGWRIDTEVLPLLGDRLTSQLVRFASTTRALRKTSKPGFSLYTGTSTHSRGAAEVDRGARLSVRVLPFGRRATGQAFQLQRVLQGVAAAVRSAGVVRVPHDFRRTRSGISSATVCPAPLRWRWWARRRRKSIVGTQS